MQEVETSFQEAGHCLQHMMTEKDEGLVSGIRGIEWNAVRRLRLPLQCSVVLLCMHLMGMSEAALADKSQLVLRHGC